MSEKDKTEFNPNDRVRVISIPVVENNEYGQLQINNTLHKEGKVNRVYKNGIRNIQIMLDGWNYNYYSPENLELLTHLTK